MRNEQMPDGPTVSLSIYPEQLQPEIEGTAIFSIVDCLELQ